jgi:hypothetical protein
MSGDFAPPACPRGLVDIKLAVDWGQQVPPMQKSLTDAFIRSIVPPADGRLEYADLRCGGLELRVTTAGARSWSFRFRDPRTGRVGRATIGSYPAIGLSAARSRADGMRQDVAAGINPAERKRRERVDAPAKTFGALAVSRRR